MKLLSRRLIQPLACPRQELHLLSRRLIQPLACARQLLHLISRRMIQRLACPRQLLKLLLRRLIQPLACPLPCQREALCPLPVAAARHSIVSPARQAPSRLQIRTPIFLPRPIASSSSLGAHGSLRRRTKHYLLLQSCVPLFCASWGPAKWLHSPALFSPLCGLIQPRISAHRTHG